MKPFSFLISLLFLCALAVSPARADSSTGVVYSISNIEVDATASTAVRAREVAILGGHASALQRLLRRLTLPEDWPRLPRLSGKEAQLLAVGYSMTNERNSATRYRGNIFVRFDPMQIQSLLKADAIPFGDVQTSAALVVPVYDLPNGRRLIWDNQNIWKDAWGRPDIGESLTPFTLPVGDIEDILALPEKAANARNRGGLFALAKRYNTNQVLLAHAKLEKVSWRGESGYALSVELRLMADRFNAEKDEVMHFALSSTLEESSNPERLVQRSVDNILRMMGLAWKRRIIDLHDELKEAEVAVSFTSLLEWQEMRNLLDAVPVIRQYQILRLDNKGALLKLNFTSTRDVLSLALKQKNIDLIVPENEEEQWRLKLLK